MPSKVSTQFPATEPTAVRGWSRVRIPLAIALAATLVAVTASRAGGAQKAAQPRPSASARPATLRDLDSLLAAGRYAAAVTPALELAAALKSRAAPDSNATATLDRVVQALLAGGRGADSSTIGLAVRAVRAHERLHGVQGIPTAAATTAWARCLAARRNDAAAASAFDRGLAIEAAQSEPDSLRVAETLEWLGRARIERGDAAGASGPILRSLAIREHALGVEHRDVARSLDALAVDLRDLGGARTLIMSLWSVEDDATRRWMNALYEARFAKGMSTMEAVRTASRAQLAQRRESGLSTHPFFWAPFVASGDWR